MSESEPWDDDPAHKFFTKQAELQRHAAEHTSDKGHRHRHLELAKICDQVAHHGYLDEPFWIVSAERLARLERRDKATRPAELIGWLTALGSVMFGPILIQNDNTSLGLLVTLFGVGAILWFASAKP